MDNVINIHFDYNNQLYSINIQKILLEITFSKFKNFDNLLESDNQNIANLIYFLYGKQ